MTTIKINKKEINNAFSFLNTIEDRLFFSDSYKDVYIHIKKDKLTMKRYNCLDVYQRDPWFIHNKIYKKDDEFYTKVSIDIINEEGVEYYGIAILRDLKDLFKNKEDVLTISVDPEKGTLKNKNTIQLTTLKDNALDREIQIDLNHPQVSDNKITLLDKDIEFILKKTTNFPSNAHIFIQNRNEGSNILIIDKYHGIYLNNYNLSNDEAFSLLISINVLKSIYQIIKSKGLNTLDLFQSGRGYIVDIPGYNLYYPAFKDPGYTLLTREEDREFKLEIPLSKIKDIINTFIPLEQEVKKLKKKDKWGQYTKFIIKVNLDCICLLKYDTSVGSDNKAHFVYSVDLPTNKEVNTNNFRSFYIEPSNLQNIINLLKIKETLVLEVLRKKDFANFNIASIRDKKNTKNVGYISVKPVKEDN